MHLRDASSKSIDVVPVENRSLMKAFIDLPWQVYEGDPNWVPPLKSEMAKLLDVKKHPFWRFSKRRLFLARRQGRPVGRIAAIIDGNYNQHYGTKMGSFGFFECERDPQAFSALFAAAEDWLRSEGMEQYQGPLNPSVNYEVGTLIDGFDRPPVLGLTYNPPYYAQMLPYVGLRKGKDLVAYYFLRTFEPPAWIRELTQSVTSRKEIWVRPVDMSRLADEVRLIHEVYNECWAENWGYVPMTEAEIQHVAAEMRFIMDPDMVFFFYFKDELAGVSVALPDVNPLLKRLNGKGGLWALAAKHLYWKDVVGYRGYIMGVKEPYRQMGLPFAAYDYVMELSAKKTRFDYMEMGWELEDNHAINMLFEEAGARPSRRFRIYQKTL